MPETIKIISSKNVEVIRSLAYDDKTPDLVKEGTIVGTGNFLRVVTLKPVSYTFKIGTNEIAEPYTFKDPVTREMVTESILTWPGVKALVNRGIFEVYRSNNRVVDLDEEVEEVITVENKPKRKTKEEKKQEKSLNDVADDIAAETTK